MTSTSALWLLAASVAVLAGCGPEPNALAGTPDPTRATADVRQPAAAYDSAAHARMFTGANDTTVHLNQGRKPRDQISYAAAIRAGRAAMANWPTGPAALPGAILPHRRIVAYYGNPHSKKMGVLGEYPEQQMLSMLDDTVATWRKADPSTPVVPAIHLVTVVAQGSAGADGGWRRRENPETIEQAYRWAQ